MSLNDKLSSLEWTSQPSSHGRKLVYDETGALVIDGTAAEVWFILWLRKLTK